MKICILENDVVDADVSEIYTGYGSMFERLFKNVEPDWEYDFFKTCLNQFPTQYNEYDAVLLTGSRADSFSDEPWVITLREHVKYLISIKMKLIGICFGHQLIALCLGSQVGRAPQGWGIGRLNYTWHSSELPYVNDIRQSVSLLASHQDQVFSLPPNAKLIASNDFCPIAAYSIDNYVFCVQAHPEFDPSYSAYLLDKRRSSMSEEDYTYSRNSLHGEHDGTFIAHSIAAFLRSSIV